MLKGTLVTLRPVQVADLEKLYGFHVSINNRGKFFPRGILSQTAFNKQYHDTGFWTKDEGLLVLVDDTRRDHRPYRILQDRQLP